MTNAKPSALVRLLMDNRTYGPGMIWLTALMLLSGAFKSYAAKFLGRAVDMGMAAQTQVAAKYLVLTLLMVLADAVRLGVFNIETARTAERMFLDVKRKAFNAVANCKLSAYESGMRSGDLLSRVTSDLPKLSSRFTDSFTWLISVFARGAIALIFCVDVSWELSAVYVLMLPILLYVMNRIGKPIQALQTDAARSSGKAYSVMAEMLNNNSVIKAFSAEARMDERFKAETDAQRRRLDQAAKKGTVLSLVAYLSDIMLLAVVFLFGGWLIVNGRISFGAFVTFVTLTGSIREAFGLIDRGISTVRESEALAQRLYEALDLPSERSCSNASVKPIGDDETAVSTRGLRFAYTPGKPVLNDIQICVKRGQHVGIIGPSGCGKSTLMRLISGLYRSYEGEMKVFGVPADRIPLDALRARIAMVSQNPYLFRGTIAENVLYGNLSATAEQVEAALRKARLWDFVNTLEDGVNSQIGDGGSRVSGGQRQRIAIARALIRDAELVILDEASSALDTKTESEIQTTMEEAFKDKTVVVIAHRFTAIRDVDMVFCMEDGRVIEWGETRELMARDSHLRRMAVAQGGVNA